MTASRIISRYYTLRRARFETGKPADPTKHMSEEDAAKWKAMNEEHRDKFKAASACRIVARYLRASDSVAMEFPTEDALKKYLEKHPGADKSRHTVKKPGEGKPSSDDGGTTSEKAHPLDLLKGDPSYAKLRSGKATPDEYRSALDKLEAEEDKLYEGGKEPAEDDPKLQSIQTAREHLDAKFQESVPKSPDYTTKRVKGYYPQKKPVGYQDAAGAAAIKNKLPPGVLEFAERMPDEDLDKNEAYNHPKVKALSKALQQKVKSGEMSHEALVQQMVAVEKLRSELHDGFMKAENDKELDGWRFPSRQLYKVWQGYNDAIQASARAK